MHVILKRHLVRRWLQRRTAINTRILRDSANPLRIGDKLFEKCFRVTKARFTYLCSILAEKLKAPQRSTFVPVEIKILTTLNFLATGSFQNKRRDWLPPISQPMASRCINEVVLALNNLMNVYIKFPVSIEERTRTKMRFYRKYGFPEVLGCIDGTLVAILTPRNHPNEPAFLSHHGYHAINAAIICDSDMKITGICAKFGGAAHDSIVLNSWSLSKHLEEQSNSGKRGWLLGDSGYPQTPWLMTPVLNTIANTPEAHYTNMHERTRVCVEQCIGLLKSRWQCLFRCVLHYKPAKCAQIINACAVLHNLCLNDGVQIDVPSDIVRTDKNVSIPPSYAGNVARQQLLSVLWENRS